MKLLVGVVSFSVQAVNTGSMKLENTQKSFFVAFGINHVAGEIVFILCARSPWQDPFDVVSKILLEVTTGAKKLKSTAKFCRCVFEQYCRQRDWNANTL